MSFKDFWQLLTRNPAGYPTPQQPAPGTPQTTAGLPVKRISVDDTFPSLLQNLGDNLYSFVLPRNWPLVIYDLMNDLCLQIPDLRQAVGHIVNLGNTGHLLKIAGDSDSAIDAAVERIQYQSAQIFPYSAGPDGLINNMFRQIACSGALSMEWVPRADLKGIDKVFIVPVGEIRWVPRADMMGYYPVQVPKNLGNWLKPQQLPAIVLNTRTYYYANIEQLESCPYAIPPFIAALEPVALQRAMLKNINKVMKKLGVMGLCTYAITPPAQRPGENEQTYNSRCLAHLNNVMEQVKNNFGDGIAVGFKGAFDFSITGVTGDAKGVAEMFKINEEQLFSAIQADPAMHGRTYSTTETYASVVYSKMISQLANVQRMVAHGLEFGWGLDFLLGGLPAEITVEFKASQALSNLQEAQSEMVEIANAEALYTGGVIDQTEKANRLGYPTAAETEPRPDPAVAQDPNLEQRPKTGGKSDNTPSNKTVKRKQAKVKSSATFEFNATMKKYVRTSNPILVNTALQTFAKKKDDEHEHAEQDPQLESHLRRYL